MLGKAIGVDYNTHFFTGHVSIKPVLKEVKKRETNGKKEPVWLLTFAVGCNCSPKFRNRVNYFNCVAWGKNAVLIDSFDLNVGDGVFILGEPHSKRVVNKHGIFSFAEVHVKLLILRSRKIREDDEDYDGEKDPTVMESDDDPPEGAMEALFKAIMVEMGEDEIQDATKNTPAERARGTKASQKSAAARKKKPSP